MQGNNHPVIPVEINEAAKVLAIAAQYAPSRTSLIHNTAEGVSIQVRKDPKGHLWIQYKMGRGISYTKMIRYQL